MNIVMTPMEYYLILGHIYIVQQAFTWANCVKNLDNYTTCYALHIYIWVAFSWYFNSIKIQDRSTLEIHNWIMDIHNSIYGAP